MSKQKQRPILFDGSMVRAILSGRKTQTRQLWWGSTWGYLHPGDLLWVRETVMACQLSSGRAVVVYWADGRQRPIRDTVEDAERWIALYHYRGREGATVPSIHMPRWVSRITLRVTRVRVERVQDITEHDARAEGCRAGDRYRVRGTDEIVVASSARESFSLLWDSISNKRGPGWDSNPLVWAIEFTVDRNLQDIRTL